MFVVKICASLVVVLLCRVSLSSGEFEDELVQLLYQKIQTLTDFSASQSSL